MVCNALVFHVNKKKKFHHDKVACRPPRDFFTDSLMYGVSPKKRTRLTSRCLSAYRNGQAGADIFFFFLKKSGCRKSSKKKNRVADPSAGPAPWFATGGWFRMRSPRNPPHPVFFSLSLSSFCIFSVGLLLTSLLPLLFYETTGLPILLLRILQQ